MPPPEPPLPAPAVSRWRWLTPLIGGVCALLGLVVLIGWHARILPLVQLRPTLAPMQYNTALCFLLAGIGLITWRRTRLSMVTPILGGLVATAGLLTLSEYIFHANLGIDQWLFRSYITTGTSHVGRMSPVSSLSFALAGVSLILLGWGAASRRRLMVVGSLASVICSISAVAALGYAFGLPGTYGWGELTRIAIHTAAGLGFLGAGLFTLAWRLERASGERVPLWLPVPVVLSLLTGTLVLYFALDSKQDEEIAQTVKAGAESARNQMAVRMEGRIRSLVRMARRWEFSGAPTQAAWEADAKNYAHDFPDLQAVEWIDAEHIVRWVIPLAGNEAKLNLNLTLEERRKAAVERAELEHQPAVTRIVRLFRGGLGFVVYVPMTVNGRFEGFIAAIFNAQDCFSHYLPPTVAAGEALQLSEGGLVFFERDAEAKPGREKWLVTEHIAMHGAEWDLRVWPTPALAGRLDSPLPEVILAAGVLGALLLGAVCYYGQRAARQAVETRRANALLQAALDEVKTLSELLPICCQCKRVRDDTGYWNQIDSYLHRHAGTEFSHGYCPECAAKAFTDFGLAVPERIQTELAAGKFE